MTTSSARRGPDQDQTSHPLGMETREMNAHRSAFRESEQEGTLETGRIHHGLDVATVLLEIGNAKGRIGQALSAFVEGHDPGEAGERIERSARGRQGVHHVQMRNDARGDDQRERTRSRSLYAIRAPSLVANFVGWTDGAVRALSVSRVAVCGSAGAVVRSESDSNGAPEARESEARRR
jgi:hypothetical protein